MLDRILLLVMVFFAGVFANQHLNQSPLEKEVTSIIREKSKVLGELRTASLKTVTMISVSKKNEWETWFGDVPLGSMEVKYQAVGEIDAGINLSRGYSVTQTGENTVEVTLPAPQVLDTKLDLNQSKPISTERNWISPNAEGQLISKAQRTAVAALEKEACNGLLQQARGRAKQIMKQLSPGVNLEVEIKKPNCEPRQ